MTKNLKWYFLVEYLNKSKVACTVMQHCHSLLLKAFRLQNTMLEKSCSLYANAGLIAVTILKVCYAGGLMQSLTVTVWSILYYKIVIKIFWRCENIPVFDSESILGAWCSPYTVESILYYRIVIKIFWRCKNIPIFDSESILGRDAVPILVEVFRSLLLPTIAGFMNVCPS